MKTTFGSQHSALHGLLKEHHYACTLAPGELILTTKVEFNKIDQIILSSSHRHPVTTSLGQTTEYSREGEIVFTIEPHYEEERFAEPYIEIVDIKYYRYFDDIVNPENEYGIWMRVPNTLGIPNLNCENQMTKAAIEELGEMDKEIYDEPEADDGFRADPHIFRHWRDTK
ncbi:uncharacterized protein METZ01_LOCUS102590 [marine metagenome]|uniref:Uncharacterized protein n=1 Tax=marine metagenome TaxID=408172 RepID=A0A381WB20_9ZZZZ